MPEESIVKRRRISIDAFNKVCHENDIYVVGDICLQLVDEKFPNGHPQFAKVAMQQAKNLGTNFKRMEKSEKLNSLKYNDK